MCRARWLFISFIACVFVFQTTQCFSDEVVLAETRQLACDLSAPLPVAGLSASPTLFVQSGARSQRIGDSPDTVLPSRLRPTYGLAPLTCFLLSAESRQILPPRPSARGFIFFSLPPPA